MIDYKQSGYTVQTATEADIPLIRELAWKIFPATYRTIITEEQIAYMMEWMYSEDSLRRQLADGHTFLLGFSDGQPIGYASVERQGPDLFHLQKLYVLPGRQGSGGGRFLFESAVDYVRTLHPTPCTIELNVNRTNPALGFYRHMGMHIDRQDDFDIGHGYYMNDYIMALNL